MHVFDEPLRQFRVKVGDATETVSAHQVSVNAAGVLLFITQEIDIVYIHRAFKTWDDFEEVVDVAELNPRLVN